MLVKQFSDLFTGRTNAYGFNQTCLKEPLTEEIYADHLKGEQRIGVYPIVERTLTKWAVIDIDEQNFNLARDFAMVATKNGVNAYIERSKSKGFHCLLPNQKIITKKGYKNIEDIQVGEYVLTDKRRFRKVTKVFKHDYTGDICEFSLNYTPEKIRVTNDHRCLNDTFEWEQAKNFKVGDKMVFPIQKSDSMWNRFNLPRFKKTTHMNYPKEKYLVTNKKNITKLTNPKLWWLVGLYLAEGSLYNLRKARPRGTNSRIIFAIGEKEKHLLNKFKHYYEELYVNFKVTVENPYGGAQRFIINNRHFFELIKLFGRTKTKHLPRWVMNLNKQCRDYLIKGYFDGDGHYDKKHQRGFTSVCLDLLKGFQELLLKDGEISSIQIHSEEKEISIQGKKCHKQKAYRLIILNNPMLGKIKHNAYGIPQYFLPRIKKIRTYQANKEKVYNLEVEEDNSYVTSLGAVHNCWMFLEDFIPALEARLVIEMFLKEMEYICEVFPKQDETTEEHPYGNFIFLPLFGGNIKEGKTVFVDSNNEIIISSVEELSKIKLTPVSVFKDIIELNELKREKTIITPESQSKPRLLSNSTLPCIERIKAGIKRGHRNECAFRLSIYLKDRGLAQDEVHTLIEKWNDKNEPAKDKSRSQTLQELQGVVSSVFKGKYKSYGCESGIILEYCDKETCPIILAQDKKAQIEKGLIVLIFRDPKTMVFRKSNYEYRLTNFDFSKSGKYKCSLTLSNMKEEKIIFKDFVSLDTHTHRERFVKASKDKDVDNDIIKIEDLVRKQLEKEEKEKIAKAKQLYVMTEKEKNEAVRYLENTPHILKDVIALTNQMGIVGEEIIRLMVYLCFTSRILKEPLSITIKGESSSGKSYIPTRVKQLLPEEGVFFITRATANAFYHLPEDGMQHKIIFIEQLT